MKKEIRRALVDGHMHLSHTARMSRIENVADVRAILHEAELRAVCVQNIVLWEPQNLPRNAMSLLLKAYEPERVFAFAGLRHPAPESGKHMDYAEQAARLIALGFDGIKMFGKPNIRRQFGEPFDAPSFDALYAYLEREQIPILFHMGDPRAFWNAAAAPAFAQENGWLYTRSDDIPFDAQYAEIERLLARYPRLRVVFAHFYFLSDDLPALANFLRRHPTVRIDVTPGSEMYENFSRNPEQAHAFFREFAARIHFGTDNVGRAEGESFDPVREARERIDTVWDFLSSNRASGWGQTFTGLCLPDAVLECIAYRNFYAFVGGERPKLIALEKTKEYIKELQALADEAGHAAAKAQLARVQDAFSNW